MKEYGNKIDTPDRSSFYMYVIKDKGDTDHTCIFYIKNRYRIYEVNQPACFIDTFVHKNSGHSLISMKFLMEKKIKEPLEQA